METIMRKVKDAQIKVIKPRNMNKSLIAIPFCKELIFKKVWCFILQCPMGTFFIIIRDIFGDTVFKITF